MIWELIVTSAPRGLKPGRSGFTTVLQTRGIHTALAESLEKASAYNHVYPQGDPRNPQIHAHSVRQGAWGTASVLSRIVDAGNGYDGRSNKLAHHVAFDAKEVQDRAKSSPAAVLLHLERANAFQRLWQGDPREQPAGPVVPAMPVEPGPCAAWTRAAGDAGWAGFIADRAVSKQPTWIVAPPGEDLVKLFAEALALVNYHQRWGITFTSYALDAGDALWLGTVDGSPQAQAARGQTRIPVVDLVRRPPLTVQSPLIAAARGVGTVPWKREAVAPAAVGATTVTVPGPAASIAGADVTTASGSRPPPVGGRPPVLARGGVPLPGDLLSVPGEFSGGDAGDVYLPPQPGRRWLVPTLVTGVLAVVGILGVVVGVNPEARKRFVAIFGPTEPENNEKPPPKPSPEERKGSPKAEPEKIDPPKQAPAASDFVATAENAKKTAAEQSAFIKAKGTEANKLLIDITEKSLPSLRSLVAAAETAVANGRSDDGRPPQKVLDDAAKEQGDVDDAIKKLKKIGTEVETAVEAAQAAAAQAKNAVETAEKKGASADAINRARVAADAARHAAAEAEKDAETLGGLAQVLAEPEQAITAAKATLSRLQELLEKDAKAFAALKARLEQAGHTPTQGIDATNPGLQRAVLCEVGEARIDLALPNEIFYQPENLVFVCERGEVRPARTEQHPSEATLPDGDFQRSGSTGKLKEQKQSVPTWEFSCRVTGQNNPPVSVGKASIEDGKLILELQQSNAGPDTYGYRPLARDALACAVLRITSVQPAGSATPPADTTTYVQLAKPVEAGPIVIKQLLGKTKHSCPLAHSLPKPPKAPGWKTVFTIDKAECRGLQGELIADASVTPDQGKGTGNSATDPITWSVLWKWKDEPIVVTDFAAHNKDLGEAVVRVIDGRPQGQWNSRQRLLPLISGTTAKFPGFPTTVLLESQVTKVKIDSLKPIWFEIVDGLSQGIEDPKIRKSVVDQKSFIGGLKSEVTYSLTEWVNYFRTVKVIETPCYQKWVDATYPVGQLPAPDAPDNQKKSFDQKIGINRNAKAGQPEYVKKFWKEMEPRFAANEFGKEGDEWLPKLIREFAIELEQIDKGKAEVRKLLEGALGYKIPEDPKAKNVPPDATLTGAIVIEFPSGGRSVLVSFRPKADEANPQAAALQQTVGGTSSPTGGEADPAADKGAPAGSKGSPAPPAPSAPAKAK